MTTEEELFLNCPGCDQAYMPDAPDREHTEPKKKKEDAKDPIPMNYTCDNCGETMTVFWGIPKTEEP